LTAQRNLEPPRTAPPPPPTIARSAPRRRALRAVLSLVVMPILLGLVILLVLTGTPWGNERVRRLLVSQANQRTTGELAVGTLRGNLLAGATLTDVRLVDSARQPVFAARRVQVRYALLPALRGKVVIRSLVLDTVTVVLDKRPGAKWNFQSLMRPGTRTRDTSQHGVPPELANVTIRQGHLIYRRPWRPDSTLAPDALAAAITAALSPAARKRTERVPGGYQRVLDYRAIDASLPAIAIGQGGTPTAVRIASLSMLAEPYRPPAIDVRSLTGTLYAGRDSLWWRGARMALPSSQVSGDGTIGFRGRGFSLDLTGAPVALADLRWLDPKLPTQGGGRLRYSMRIHGDTSEFAVADADVRYRDATLVGSAALTRVSRVGRKSALLVRGADLTVARLTTSVLRELAPDIRIARTGTLDGHVAVSGASSALQVNADLRFDDAAAGESHLIARGGVGTEGGMSARNLSVQVLPLRIATLSGSGVRIPVGGVLTGEATVSGSANAGWTVRGDLTHQGEGDRSHVVGNGSYRVAGKRIVADATLRPLSLATVGRFAPSAQLRGSVAGRVHAEGTTRDLRITGNLSSTSGGGSIQGRGAVVLNGSRTRYDVAVAMDALNAFAFSRRAPRTSLTGDIAARGIGTRLATADATVSADLVRSRYDSFSVDRIRGRLAVAGGLARVDTLDVAASGAHAQASGTLGLVRERAGTLHFSAAVDSLGSLRRWLGSSDTTIAGAPAARQSALVARARADSARRAEASRIERLALGLPEGERLVVDTLPGIRRDSLAGSLAAAGTLRGNIQALGVDAKVEGRDLVARGSAVGRLAATVRSTNVRTPARSVVFAADADLVQTSGYAFDAVRAKGEWKDGRLMSDLFVKQDSLISYAALGSYERSARGEQRVHLDSLAARFDTLVWRLARPGTVRLSHGDAAVDSIDLRSSAGGRLFADGTLPRDGAVRLDVAAENVRVSTVLAALQKDAAGDGVIAATARITGTRALPLIAGHTTLREARYGSGRAPDADVDVRYEARRLAVEATARDSTGRRVLNGAASLPLDLALMTVNGGRKLAGPVRADVVVDTFALATLPLSSRGVADVRGFLTADARVRGSWSQPEYTGRAALRDAGLAVTSLGMKLTDAVADLHLVGDTLRLDSLVAMAKGPLRASGTVDLTDRSRPFVDLTASAHDFRLMDATRGLVDADGEVRAIGPLDELRVTGRAEMLRGFLALKQFNKNLLRVKAPGSLSFFTVFDTTTPPAELARRAAARAQHHRVGIIADLSLVVDRNNYYRNRPDANTEFHTGEGEEVRAHIDTRSDEQWAVGFVRIGEGVAIFRASTFRPARGSLTLLPRNGSPGFIEQVGEREVWEPGRGIFPVQLLTGGTSKAPALGLESGTLFPMRGRELNGYLTMGRSFTSQLQQSGSSLSGSEAWSGQLSGETGALAHRQQAATALGVVLHDLGTGATKEFGLDAFSVSPSDIPTELVFGKTGGVRGALIEGGRYATVDRYIAGQMRLTSGIPGARMSQRFGTTYRLDLGLEPRFLFGAPEELGITHPTVRTGVFGAFLTRLWSW
jgi:autotransporter translocation and assembly factor TamB